MRIDSTRRCVKNHGSGENRLPSGISHSGLGLFPGTKPLGKSTRRGRTPSYHGVFGGHKALGLAVFDSLLERDFQTVLCADPRIESYAVQSHQLTYWIPRPDGTQKAHIYTPDICALRRNGSPLVIEVKHSSFLTKEYWVKREPHIRRAYAEDHGVQYLVVTEREVRVQPRLTNFQIMLRHSQPFDDIEADIAARDALSRLPKNPRLGEVCDASMLRNNHLSRSYSALLRLALRGEITLDIDTPLSLSTKITGGARNG